MMRQQGTFDNVYPENKAGPLAKQSCKPNTALEGKTGESSCCRCSAQSCTIDTDRSEEAYSPTLSRLNSPRTAGTESHYLESCADPELDNLRIQKLHALIYPQLLIEEIPAGLDAKVTVTKARREIGRILHGKDDRIVVIAGPCSIHDIDAALEYAGRLKQEAQRLHKQLLILMRVYFEKPRTTVGWKGLINDPDLNNTFEINKGLRLGRQLLADINSMGLPVGCEYLDTLIPQYTADLVSWAAIGARTTECQLHRELASGLSMPVGFKNGTSGDVQVAVEACMCAQSPHAFLGITKQGLPAICHSRGNPDVHVILRGGKAGTNYSERDVNEASAQLLAKKCVGGVIVDFSHGNSLKDHKKQRLVCEEISRQISSGSMNISGVMIESHLFEGAQNVDENAIAKKSAGDLSSSNRSVSRLSAQTQSKEILTSLKYGISITDKCISWEETVQLLDMLAAAVEARRKSCSASAPV